MVEPALQFKIVNRAEQLNEVRSKLNTIRLGRKVFDSVLEWYGIPGIGKTTLGEMIADLCVEMKVPFSRVDFDSGKNPRAEQYIENPVMILEDLFVGLGVEEAKTFREALERYHQTEPGSFIHQDRQRRVVEAFREYLERLMEQGPVVLLFDTTDQAPAEVTTWLEEQLISPLALTGKCLIIWTGRYPQRWKRFEVRRRVVSQKLEPLPEKFTIEHVGPIGSKVYRLTRGHPMGNEEVARAIEEYRIKGQEALDRELLNRLMDRVIDRYVMKGIDPDLNAALRVLAVVRQFDVIFLQRLLSKFVPEFKDLREALFLEVLSRLAGTYLVEWDRVRKGYAIDLTLRRVLALHLRYNQQERYLAASREEAAELYADWIERVPENRSIYVVERLYHRACIALAEGKPAGEVAIGLQKELENYLQRYYRNGDRALAQKATEQLRQELQGDDELQEMLGEAFGSLPQSIEAHLNALR